MARLPRIQCPVCDGVYGGVPTTVLGMVAVRDHKTAPRSLSLCPGSMTRVRESGALAWQDELPTSLTALIEQPDAVQTELFR
ncbi:hypothetical protein ACEZCY_04485 [Streptacidiphilus sp. N1-12]|uniref:Uncharacterized protein n=2 Tax=Streptacidiphilus alkalitolerans TaxID=3342712 RepID=A0ABV6W8V1_9ACTN